MSKYEPWVEKCMKCRHAYEPKDDPDLIACRCRNGCNFKPVESDVLISLKPHWWEKVLSGEKTIEVRKSAPKALIAHVWVHESGSKDAVSGYIELERNPFEEISRPEKLDEQTIERTCLTMKELIIYANHRPLYLWKIKRAVEQKTTMIAIGAKFAPQSWCYVKGK